MTDDNQAQHSELPDGMLGLSYRMLDCFVASPRHDGLGAVEFDRFYPCFDLGPDSVGHLAPILGWWTNLVGDLSTLGGLEIEHLPIWHIPTAPIPPGDQRPRWMGMVTELMNRQARTHGARQDPELIEFAEWIIHTLQASEVIQMFASLGAVLAECLECWGADAADLHNVRYAVDRAVLLADEDQKASDLVLLAMLASAEADNAALDRCMSVFAASHGVMTSGLMMLVELIASTVREHGGDVSALAVIQPSASEEPVSLAPAEVDLDDDTIAPSFRALGLGWRLVEATARGDHQAAESLYERATSERDRMILTALMAKWAMMLCSPDPAPDGHPDRE